MDLGIDPDQLGTCVQCGLCLSSCPTYRVTGDETFSPRGRIALMRQVQLYDAPLTSEVTEAFDTCIQCLGCEPACPSVVPYGHFIESTRNALTEHRGSRRRAIALWPLTKPRLLRLGSSLLAVAQRLRLIPARLGLPDRLPLRRRPHQTSGTDVYLFTGCVMDAWQREVHFATQRVLEAAGFGVTPTGDAAGCCGALHTHAGLAAHGERLTKNIDAALNPTIPVIVNSAGCGAHLKQYSSRQIFDAQEFLAEHLDRLPDVTPLEVNVAVQDPCHLRHVQRAHLPPRTLLRKFVSAVTELDDDGLCCGAGGAYSVLQPDMSQQVRERKLASINRSQPEVVASANPGCSMHLSAAGVKTEHPMVLVDRALAANSSTT